MTRNPQSISTFSISADAYQTYRSLRRKFLQLTVFSVFLPIFTLELVLSHLSNPFVDQVKVLVRSLNSNQGARVESFLEVISPFFSMYLVGLGALMILVFSGYMGIVKITLSHLRNEHVPSASEGIIWGLRQFFPKGFLFVCIFILFTFERFLWGPFWIFSMLIMMAPVLYTAEGGRLWASIKGSLFSSYVSSEVSSGMNAAFSLIVFGALLFFAKSLLDMVARFLLNLDVWFGLARTVWNQGVFDFPFTWAFFVVNLAGSFLVSMLITSMALFTCMLYIRASEKTPL